MHRSTHIEKLPKLSVAVPGESNAFQVRYVSSLELLQINNRRELYIFILIIMILSLKDTGVSSLLALDHFCSFFSRAISLLTFL